MKTKCFVQTVEIVLEHFVLPGDLECSTVDDDHKHNDELFSTLRFRFLYFFFLYLNSHKRCVCLYSWFLIHKSCYRFSFRCEQRNRIPNNFYLRKRREKMNEMRHQSNTPIIFFLVRETRNLELYRIH